MFFIIIAHSKISIMQSCDNCAFLDTENSAHMNCMKRSSGWYFVKSNVRLYIRIANKFQIQLNKSHCRGYFACDMISY